MSLEDIAANSSFEAEVEDKSGRYESSRKWEWGYLRVSFLYYNQAYNSFNE